MPAEELIAKWELGKGIVTAVEKPNYLYEIFSIPWAYFRDRVLHLEPKEIAENL